MARALYFEVLSYTQENLDLLASNFDLEILPDPRRATDAHLAVAEVIFAPLGYRFDGAFMDRCPKLKVLATNTTGVPHIDLQAAEARGVAVVSLKDETEFLRTITPTAELTVALMLAITRNLAGAFEAVLQGGWSRWNFGGQKMLSRMSLGVVGLGRLGEMVARYCRCMGMEVGYYDPYREPAAPAEAGYRRFETLEALVSSVDVVSLHVPMNETNKHMFSKEIFGLFQKGAYFVNTARGELVDNAALIEALACGQLAGAAVDVLDGEFDPDFQAKVLSHPLVQYAKAHRNLIISPHIGGSTRDAWALTQKHTIECALAVCTKG